MNIDKWLNEKSELKALAKDLDMPSDWHNADCLGVEAFLYENTFDNAHCDESEAYIVLEMSEATGPDTPTQRFAINAANLFAWACAGTADGKRGSQ